MRRRRCPRNARLKIKLVYSTTPSGGMVGFIVRLRYMAIKSNELDNGVAGVSKLGRACTGRGRKGIVGRQHVLLTEQPLCRRQDISLATPYRNRRAQKR